MRKTGARRSYAGPIAGSAALLAAALGSSVQAQPSGGAVEMRQWTTAEDHRHMQAQLGIREVRPGLGALDYGVFLAELDRLGPDTPLMLEHLPTPEEYDLAAGFLRAAAAQQGIAL